MSEEQLCGAFVEPSLLGQAVGDSQGFQAPPPTFTPLVATDHEDEIDGEYWERQRDAYREGQDRRERELELLKRGMEPTAEELAEWNLEVLVWELPDQSLKIDATKAALDAALAAPQIDVRIAWYLLKDLKAVHGRFLAVNKEYARRFGASSVAPPPVDFRSYNDSVKQAILANPMSAQYMIEVTSAASKFTQLMPSPMQAIRPFAVAEFCAENIDFLIAVDNFKTLCGEANLSGDFTASNGEAARIIALYVWGEQEINLSYGVRKKFNALSAPYGADVFDEAYAEIYCLIISGTLLRFISNQDFVTYKEVWETFLPLYAAYVLETLFPDG